MQFQESWEQFRAQFVLLIIWTLVLSARAVDSVFGWCCNLNIQWKICQKSNYQLKVKETKSNPSSGAVKQTVLIAYFYVWLVNNNCCKVKLKLLVFDIFICQQFADYSIFQYYCGFGHPEQVFSSSNPQVKKNDLCDSIT